MKQEYKTDIDNLLSTQNINGGKYWATSDGAITKGSPFSTLEIGILLSEIGYKKQSE